MSSLKKNIIYNTIYQVLVIILPLITAPYIARVLGKNGVGIYSYTHSIANYFVLCEFIIIWFIFLFLQKNIKLFTSFSKFGELLSLKQR